MADNSVVVKVEGGPPPDYSFSAGNSNVPPGYTNEPPPSYESVFGRVRQMREESDGNAQFAKKMVGCILCGTVFSVVTIIAMLAIPLACLVFGALYIGQCPREPYIPIYLIVAGVVGLVKAVLGIVQQILKRKSATEDGEEVEGGAQKIFRIIDGPIGCFLMSWFIAGSVWIYRIHKDYSDDPSSTDYCQPTLYLFAFWIITVQYILIALSILCCCVGIIIVCCVAGKSQDT